VTKCQHEKLCITKSGTIMCLIPGCKAVWIPGNGSAHETKVEKLREWVAKDGS
jgi:hypothetical protein